MSRFALFCCCVPLVCILDSCGPSVVRFTSQGSVRSAENSASHELTGIASYYADDFHGRVTSNGETYDMNSLTAAHPTLPFNTRIRVVNLENKKSVIVRINDRGPFKKGRVIDVSLQAAKELGMITNGTAPVMLEILEGGG